MMVDPDVPHATAGTREKPLLHWLLADVMLVYPFRNVSCLGFTLFDPHHLADRPTSDL
jgi:hypothetical protein